MLTTTDERQPAKVTGSDRPLGFWQVYRAARRNQLEIIPAAAFREPVVANPRTGWLMVTDPDALERVLRTHEARYTRTALARRVLKPREGDNLLTAHRETWAWQRRALAPIFGPREVRAIAPSMTAAADATTGRFAAAASAGPVDVYPEMVAATCDVILDAALSRGESIDRDAMTRGITAVVLHAARPSIMDLLRLPAWIPRPGSLIARLGAPRMDQVTDRIVAARKAEGQVGAPDILDHLIGARDAETGQAMTDLELRNNLLTFITAGHETTALALTWSLYLAAFDQAVQTRARAVAQDVLGERTATAGDLPQLGYIRQIIDEALRLYPPAALISRSATVGDDLAGHPVKPGQTVLLPYYAVHRHRLLWDRPDDFDPDRWAPGASEGRHRFAYLPFGAGPRSCIGSHLALAEAQIILATLLARFSFALVPEARIWPRLIFTLRPGNGMPLMVRRL